MGSEKLKLRNLESILSTMDFQVFHDYNRLARIGAVEYLKCPDDNYSLSTMIGFDDQPALICFLCGNVTHPGTRVYEELQAAIAAYQAR